MFLYSMCIHLFSSAGVEHVTSWPKSGRRGTNLNFRGSPLVLTVVGAEFLCHLGIVKIALKKKRVNYSVKNLDVNCYALEYL